MVDRWTVRGSKRLSYSAITNCTVHSGRTADHAIVMAQLYTNQNSYGPHPFIVPIRNLQSRKPLNGITIFDIGPKFGYQTTDNGSILFNQYRIPHGNMLARFSRVEVESGEYVKPKKAALAYGTSKVSLLGGVR